MNCAQCDNTFAPAVYENRHGRSARPIDSAKYCSPRCRTAACRTRRQRGAETASGGSTSRETAPFRLGPLHSLVTPVARKLPDGLIRDAIYPNMYRLLLADGSLSDMTNLTRAKDALWSRRAG